MFRDSVDGVGTKEVEGLGTEGTTGTSSSLGFLSHKSSTWTLKAPQSILTT
jgi:hypothetical protein